MLALEGSVMPWETFQGLATTGRSLQAKSLGTQGRMGGPGQGDQGTLQDWEQAFVPCWGEGRGLFPCWDA